MGYPPKLDNFKSKKFGKLTALKFSHMSETNSMQYWLFECDCGNKIIKRRHHVEKNVQHAAVKIIGRDQRPPPSEPMDRNHAGGSHQNQTAVIRRQKCQRVQRNACFQRVDKQRQYKHGDIGIQNAGDDPRFQSQFSDDRFQQQEPPPHVAASFPLIHV